VVDAQTSVSFRFELVGVGLGVQRISGVRVSLTPLLPASSLANTAATVMHDFDHLHQLEITANEQ